MNSIETLLSEMGLSAYGPLNSVVLTPRFPASRHVIFLLIPQGHRDPVLVAKVPRLPEQSDGLEREVANLQAVHALRPRGFDGIPRVVIDTNFHGFPVLIETALNGPLLSPAMMRRAPQESIAQVIDWLIDIHRLTTPPTNDWFEQLAQPALQDLEAKLPSTEMDLLVKLREILRPLQGARLPYVVEHGDLGHPNIVRMAGGRIGVIDWETSSLNGLIGGDLFFFLSYAAFSLNHANERGSFTDIFREAFFGVDAWAVPYIERYLQHISIPRSVLAPIFVLQWTRYLSSLLTRVSAGESDQSAGSVRATPHENRYFELWRYAITHVEELLPGCCD